jgi:hypothetical protein
MQNDHNKAIAIALNSENTIPTRLNDVVLMNGNEGPNQNQNELSVAI